MSTSYPVNCRIPSEDVKIVDAIASKYCVDRSQVLKWAILTYIHEDLDVPPGRL